MRIILILTALIMVSSFQEFKFPGWPPYTFKTYSGFAPVAGGDRQFHYVFLESKGDPNKDPVLLWLSGGPACSSIMGLLGEIGPYIIDETSEETKFFPDDGYGWNNVANVIFLESPAGVGYSTIPEAKKQTFTFDDQTTGADNYEALLGWFKDFPQFQGRDFYIAGDSYAGAYIPFTAHALTEGNKVPDNIKINLKGILIGNGVIVGGDAFRVANQIQYLANRNFFDLKTKHALLNQCLTDQSSVSCTLAQRQAESLISHLNVYNVYQLCQQTDSTKEEFKTPINFMKYLDKDMPVNDTPSVPCRALGSSTNYMNSDEVRKAMGLESAQIWATCDVEIYLRYQKDQVGSIQFFPDLHQNGVRILLFTGDQDSRLSVVNTYESLKKLTLKETKAWRPIADDTGLVNGWLTQYDMLDFYIVRAAGHGVAGEQRKVAYNMFKNYISGGIKDFQA